MVALLVVGAAGTARADVTASPTTVDCGTVAVGAAGSATTQLTDTDLPDTVDVVGVDSACTAFAFAPTPVSLLTGLPQTETVTFTPTARGAVSCSVNVLDDATQAVLGSFTVVGDAIGPVIAAPASVDFGDARFGPQDTTTQSIEVDNTGDADLLITSLSLTGADPGDFAIQTATPIDIPAGGSAQVVVVFAPTASGARDATLEIDSDAVGAAATDVALTGTGTNATIDVTPSIDFGAVADSPDATTATATIEVNNDGPDPAGALHVATATLADTSGWFAFAASTGCAGQTTCTLDVDVTTGNPVAVAVACTPDALSLATNTASVTFASDSDTAGGNVTQLTCTGGRPQLAASPTSVGFGSVAIGGSTTQTVTISNTGTTTLDYALAVTGAQAGQFAITAGCTSGCTIAAGGAANTITIQFAPVLPPGAAAATIAITSDSPDGPTSIALAGTGTAALLSASPTTVAIPDTDVGGTSTATLTLANPGNVDLQITSAGLDAASSADLAVTAGSPGPLTIAAGTNAQWTLACTPVAFGAKTGHFAVASNAFGDANASIAVSCTGRQGVLQVSSTSIEFGGIRVGDAATPQSLTLSNVGNASLSSLTQAFADTTLGYTFTTTLPSSLAAGSATTVTVAFAPQALTQGGHDLATFTAASGTNPRTTVQATVDVDGQVLQADYDTDPSALAFGDILWDGSAALQLQIIQTDAPPITIETLDIAPDMTTNTQTGEFQVVAVSHAGSALSLPFQPFQLQHAGDTLLVTVVAAPANRVGAMAATLTVHSDLHTANPDRTVALTATATAPMLDLDPGATFDFGGVDLAVGSASQTFTLTNTGDGPLGIGAITGSGSPAFQLALPAPGTLAAGSAAQIGVIYRPTLEQADTTTLTVPLVGLFDDTPATQTIVITGHGIDRHIAVPSSVQFPDTFRFPDTPPVMPVAVQNSGEAPLHLSMVTPSAPFAVVGATTGLVVPGGTSLQVNVEFSPTSTGVQTGSLTIVDDDRKVPMAIVALRGTAIDRDVSIGPSMINMGTTGLGVPVHLAQLSAGGLVVTNMDASHAFTLHAIKIVTTTGTAGAFALVAPPSDVPLAAGATASFDLVFDPVIEGGYGADVELFLDADPEPHATTVAAQGVFVDAQGGGGCAAGGGAGALVAALIALGLLARRRRVAAALVIAGVATASADSTRSLDLSVFDPTPATTGTGIQLQAPSVGDAGGYAIWAMVSYARRPLALVTATGTPGEMGNDFAIENRVTYDVGGAYALLGWLEVGARLPVYTSTGEAAAGTVGYAEAPVSGTALGDLTLHAKVNAWHGGGTRHRDGGDDDALSLGGAVSLALLPTATAQQFAGVTSPELRLLALASYAVLPQLVVQANVGAVVRRSAQFENVEEKSGAMWGLGASYRVLDKLSVSAEVFGEAVPSGVLERPPAGTAMGASATLATIEALAGARYQLAPRYQLEVALGRGLDDGIGSPELRLVVGATYTPPMHPASRRGVILQGPEADSDGDGIPDSVDKCPHEPEDRDGYQDDDGCPDPDNDGDGIPDVADRCPNEAEDFDGFEDADGCPDPDNDHDGILDADDHCPNDPEDKDGYQDADGCPDPDNDHDGIPDDVDRCPDQPETINGIQDDDGCPDAGDPQVIVRPDRLELRDRVSFIGTKISSRSVGLLGQVAAQLKVHLDIARVRIAVHVQPSRDAEADLELTVARAETVREFLVARGVAASRLEAKGFGGTKPLVRPRERGAEQVNERLELVVVDHK